VRSRVFQPSGRRPFPARNYFPAKKGHPRPACGRRPIFGDPLFINVNVVVRKEEQAAARLLKRTVERAALALPPLENAAQRELILESLTHLLGLIGRVVVQHQQFPL
jgi:hypothetical protein